MNLESKTMLPTDTGHTALPGKLFGLSAAQVIALVLLFITSPLLELRTLSSLSAPANSGIWLSVQAGTWILQNHSAPHTGLFSQLSKLPWTDASWGYDLFAAIAFRWFGVRALVAIALGKFALAFAAFVLAGGTRGRFWPALALSTIAQYLVANRLPCPTYCSVVFFALELYLLSEALRSGNRRLLFWLPPLFLVWANLDAQFGFGVLLLSLFVGALLLGKFLGIDTLENHSSHTLIYSAGLIAPTCVVATIFTPYGYRPYQIFIERFTNAANSYLRSSQALGFRQPHDYLLMLLAMAAFLTLGLRRSRDPFKISLLVCAAVLSFRAERDLWLAVLASIWIIGEACAKFDLRESQSHAEVSFGHLVLPIAASIIIISIAIFAIPSRDRLMAEVAKTYPVRASDYIHANGLPQPFFNSYEWGAFLTWYLPEYAVAIDGRPGLYPDEYVEQYFKAMNAEIPYTACPAMNRASTLLLPRHSVMGEALSNVHAFRKAYDDDVAVVLVRK